ncbi:hypothetical protein CCP3SC5AM1_3040001 [Gammaproteobacteria bacterium]
MHWLGDTLKIGDPVHSLSHNFLGVTLLMHRLICVFTPLDFEFGTVLWTTEIIRELIEKEFSIFMSRSAVGRLLHRLNLTAQRPMRRAMERDSVAVDNWINKEFPKIKELAEKEGATIYFIDEAGIRTDYHAGTTWSLEGLTPVIPATGGRYRINIIAAITSEGELHFQIRLQSLLICALVRGNLTKQHIEQILL